MKKYFTPVALLLFCYLPSYANSNKVETPTEIDKAFVGCIFLLVDNKGDTSTSIGGGFLINNKFFATCYHVYKPDSNLKVVAGYVRYNFRYENGEIVNDTVSINLNYKYTSTQYDFSNHLWKENNQGTDFIVLNLSRKIDYKYPTVNFFMPKDGDSLFARTVIPDTLSKGINRLETGILVIEFRMTFKFSHPYTMYYCLSKNVREGFSGSLVIGKDGKAVGVIQQGDDTLNMPVLNNLRDVGVSDTIINKFIEGYPKKLLMCQFIELNFFIKEYLSGFINDEY